MSISITPPPAVARTAAKVGKIIVSESTLGKGGSQGNLKTTGTPTVVYAGKGAITGRLLLTGRPRHRR